MEDYEMYEQQIQRLMLNYEQNPKPIIYKKLKSLFEMYQLCLNEICAQKSKYKWINTQKKKLNQIKDNQAIRNNKIQVSKNPQPQNEEQKVLNKKHIGQLNQSILKHLVGMQRDVQTGIEVSNFIQIQLKNQIEKLDDIYDLNCETKTTLERSKNGLQTIIRRAMTNRITQILAILALLTLIGLIVVYVLKNKGII